MSLKTGEPGRQLDRDVVLEDSHIFIQHLKGYLGKHRLLFIYKVSKIINSRFEHSQGWKCGAGAHGSIVFKSNKTVCHIRDGGLKLGELGREDEVCLGRSTLLGR